MFVRVATGRVLLLRARADGVFCVCQPVAPCSPWRMCWRHQRRVAASNADEVLANEYLIGTTRTSTRRVVPPASITPRRLLCVHRRPPRRARYRYRCGVFACTHGCNGNREVFSSGASQFRSLFIQQGPRTNMRAHTYTHTHAHTHTHTRYSHTHATHTHTLLTAGSQHALRNACRQDVAV